MKTLILRKSASPWLTGIVAVISFGLISTALAAPPFKDSFGPTDDQGGFVTDCGEYAVLGNYTYAGHFIVFYDKDGFVKRVNVHSAFTNSIYYGVYYDDPSFSVGYAEPEVFLAGGPGESQQVKEIYTDGVLTELKFTGPTYKITVPGYGAIFLDGGQIVFALPSFDVIFRAGPHDFLDGEVDALCAAIEPIPFDET